MGNWRTVTITGTIDPAEVPAAREFVEIGDDWEGDRFHCLCWPGPSLCGLGKWIPVDGQVDAVGNLAKRDYDVEDVAAALTRLVAVAPSAVIKVHCSGEWESDECVATVTAERGQVSVGPPEVSAVGEGMSERGAGRMLAFLTDGDPE